MTEVFVIICVIMMVVITATLMSPESSVGIAIRYGMDSPGSNPGGGEIFHTRPDRP